MPWCCAKEKDVKRLILGALIASLIGDTLLLKPSLFLPGLVAFLVAHGFYIAAFSPMIGFLPSRAALAAIAAFAIVMLVSVWPGDRPRLKAPVVVYVGVIALMAAQAAGRASRFTIARPLRSRPGALIFMLSDTTIALMKFRQYRLARRPMDTADLLSRAGSDRILCAAADAAGRGRRRHDLARRER